MFKNSDANYGYSIKNNDSKEDIEEIKRIQNLEKLVNNLNGDIKILNDEISLLKNSLYKKRRNNERQRNSMKKQFDNLKDKYDVNQPSLLKMKSFDDLQLDFANLDNNKIKEKEKMHDFSNLEDSFFNENKRDDDSKKTEYVKSYI